MGLRPKNIIIVTMCACVMHNLIIGTYPLAAGEVDVEDGEHNLVPGAWREERQMNSLVPLFGHRLHREAKELREYLSHYYVSPAGAVPWQERMIRP